MPTTVADLIQGHPPVSASAASSVREAARVMLDRNVAAVVIMEAGRPLGIFTERDALRFFVATRRNPDLTDVGTVMTTEMVTIPPETPVDDARKLMLAKGFRHLPVTRDGSVLGVVSLRQLALGE